MIIEFNRIAVSHDDEIVAYVLVDTDLTTEQALEQAYRATQNIDGSWSQGERLQDGTPNRDFNPYVTRVAPLHVHDGKVYGLRSSMIGDLFTFRGGKTYRVASVGFEPV